MHKNIKLFSAIVIGIGFVFQASAESAMPIKIPVSKINYYKSPIQNARAAAAKCFNAMTKESLVDQDSEVTLFWNTLVPCFDTAVAIINPKLVGVLSAQQPEEEDVVDQPAPITYKQTEQKQIVTTQPVPSVLPTTIPTTSHQSYSNGGGVDCTVMPALVREDFKLAQSGQTITDRVRQDAMAKYASCMMSTQSYPSTAGGNMCGSNPNWRSYPWINNQTSCILAKYDDPNAVIEGVNYHAFIEKQNALVKGPCEWKDGGNDSKWQTFGVCFPSSSSNSTSVVVNNNINYGAGTCSDPKINDVLSGTSERGMDGNDHICFGSGMSGSNNKYVRIPTGGAPVKDGSGAIKVFDCTKTTNPNEWIALCGTSVNNTSYTPPSTSPISGSYQAMTTDQMKANCTNPPMGGPSGAWNDVNKSCQMPIITTGGSGSYQPITSAQMQICSSGQYNNGSGCADMTKEMCDMAMKGNPTGWEWTGTLCKSKIASASRLSLLGNALETLRGWFSRP